MPAKIPVTVLTGYLGAGKTTLCAALRSLSLKSVGGQHQLASSLAGARKSS